MLSPDFGASSLFWTRFGISSLETCSMEPRAFTLLLQLPGKDSRGNVTSCSSLVLKQLHSYRGVELILDLFLKTGKTDSLVIGVWNATLDKCYRLEQLFFFLESEPVTTFLLPYACMIEAIGTVAHLAAACLSYTQLTITHCSYTIRQLFFFFFFYTNAVSWCYERSSSPFVARTWYFNVPG